MTGTQWGNRIFFVITRYIILYRIPLLHVNTNIIIYYIIVIYFIIVMFKNVQSHQRNLVLFLLKLFSFQDPILIGIVWFFTYSSDRSSDMSSDMSLNTDSDKLNSVTSIPDTDSDTDSDPRQSISAQGCNKIVRRTLIYTYWKFWRIFPPLQAPFEN